MNTTVASTSDVVNLPADELRRQELKAPCWTRADRVDQSGADRADEQESPSGRRYTLELAARDYIWLYDVRHGIGDRDIAIRERVSIRQVREGVERARQMERTLTRDHVISDLKSGRQVDMGFQLMPLFPIASFTPQSTCGHNGPIRRGSSLCCMVCHSSGMDDHPGMRREEAASSTSEASSAPANNGPWPADSIGSPRTSKKRGRRRFTGAEVTQPLP